MLKRYKDVQVTSYNFPDFQEYILIDRFTTGQKNGGRKGRKCSEVSDTDRKRVAKRVKKDIRRYCMANRLYTHLTLTFESNIEDVDVADNEFKKFIKRLKYHLDSSIDFKYVAVREIQEKRKEKYNVSVIHYHVLINTTVYGSDFNSSKTFVKKYGNKRGHIPTNYGKKILSEIWNNGQIELVPHPNNLKAINYITKYVAKSIEDNEWETKNGFSKKSYLTSHNVKENIDMCKNTVVFTNMDTNEDGQAFYGMLDMIMQHNKVCYSWDNEEERETDEDVRITAILIET